jgi:hypothetical protein
MHRGSLTVSAPFPEDLADLFDDREFCDFNFSKIFDPQLKSKVPAVWLYRWVYAARNGDRFASPEFIDTVYWTLRRETFDAFQRLQPGRPISYRDWFYNKLDQFFNALTYTRLHWADDAEGEALVNPVFSGRESAVLLSATGDSCAAIELLEQFPWPEAQDLDWPAVFASVFAAKGPPGDVLGRILAHPKGILRPRGSEKQWKGNERRDRIILQALNEGQDREAICRTLDKQAVAVNLPKLLSLGCSKWIDGYFHEHGEKAMQQLISKVRRRRNAVKD